MTPAQNAGMDQEIPSMAEPQSISASRNLVWHVASSQTSFPSIVSHQLEPKVTNSKYLFKFTCLQFSSLQWVMVNLTWMHLSRLPLALLLHTMTPKSLSITTQTDEQPAPKPSQKETSERKWKEKLLLKLQLSLKRSRQRAVALMVTYVKLTLMNWCAPSLKKRSQYIMLRSAVLNHSLNMPMIAILWSRLGLRSVRVGIFELS